MIGAGWGSIKMVSASTAFQHFALRQSRQAMLLARAKEVIK
jgi:hypothetical protein